LPFLVIYNVTAHDHSRRISLKYKSNTFYAVKVSDLNKIKILIYYKIPITIGTFDLMVNTVKVTEIYVWCSLTNFFRTLPSGAPNVIKLLHI
jgi:hypothetical protein